jgi:hypothetical protein
MRRRRWRLLAALAVVPGLAAVGYGVLAGSTSRSQLARAVVWGEPDVDDHRRFPARWVAAGPTRTRFQRPPASNVPPVGTVQVLEDGRTVVRDLEGSRR